MAFTYNAGTTTPTLAGYALFNGLTVNDGTFKSQSLPPIMQNPPTNPAVTSMDSDDGGFPGTQYLDFWAFDLEGWFYVPTGLWDVQGAVDKLLASFSIQAGLQQLTLKGSGWTAKRQMLARVAGQPIVTEPALQDKKVPVRQFVVPMVAPNPVRYNADTLQAVNVASGGTTLTNNGTYPTRFVVRFNGARTNPALTGPGGLLIRYGGTIASGHWVEVGVDPTVSGGVYCTDDTGANQYANLTALTARYIQPGSSTWTGTSDSGTGNITVSFRDAW